MNFIELLPRVCPAPQNFYLVVGLSDRRTNTFYLKRDRKINRATVSLDKNMQIVRIKGEIIRANDIYDLVCNM